MSFSHKNKIIVPGVLVILAIVLEVLSYINRGFVTFYVDRVFPIITVPLAFVSGLFPFSVGEILLYLAVILIAALFLLSLVCLGAKKVRTFYVKYLIFIWNLIGIYSLIMVLNCFMLYQYPAMGIGLKATDEKTQKLIELRDYVVLKANEIAPLLPRDGEGNLIGYDDATIKIKAADSMKALKNEGYRLGGYYPKFKYFLNPAFFSQQYIMGYYFPFSMESNINGIMYKTNVPHTVCHELSHLKGYIREDEANFIGYLACVNSDDLYFEYSAYLSVLGYLDRDFYRAINEDREVYLSHPVISDMVVYDDEFLTKESWEWVDAHSILDTETVRRASRKFTDTVLTTNGVSDGINSYSRVVALLIDYYMKHSFS